MGSIDDALLQGRLTIFWFTKKRTLGAGWQHGADKHRQSNADYRKQKSNPGHFWRFKNLPLHTVPKKKRMCGHPAPGSSRLVQSLSKYPYRAMHVLLVSIGVSSGFTSIL